MSATLQQQAKLEASQPQQQPDRVSVKSAAKEKADTSIQAPRETANPAHLIDKLYAQNVNLSKEINILSKQLPDLLEKTEKTKSKKHLSASNVVSSGDGAIQKELSETYKQIAHYQKGLKTLQSKYDNSATYERYKEVENQISVKERELHKLTTEKNTLEKLTNEKERAIQTIRTQTGTDTKIQMLTEEIKELKEKVKANQNEEKKLETDADKGNSQAQKLKEELNKIKEAYRYMLEKTGYDPKEDKVRPKPSANPLFKRDSKPKSKGDKGPKEKDDLQNLEFTPANFQKIYAQVKELRKVEAQKDKDYKKESESLKERLESLKKESEDMNKKLAEKEKEANVLTIKLRELHRIARYHSILPVDEDDNLSGKGSLKVNVPSKVSAYMSPNSATNSNSKLNSPISFPTKPKLGRIDSLNDYAKHSFLYTGYRKDERGKVAQDGVGEFFSDKDLFGSSKPKIVGLKVWHDNRRVTGLQAVYKTHEGLKEGTAHVKNPQAYKLESFEMGGDDYLKEISGFTNKTEDFFDCLMFMSAKGETKKILECQRDSKLFKFDINELEFPSMIYGYLREDKPRNWVTKFGILIASDNIEEKIKHDKEQYSEKRERQTEKPAERVEKPAEKKNI